MSRRRRVHPFVGLLIATVVALLMGEVVARATWLPHRVIGPYLYRVPVASSAFRRADPVLLFTAREGAVDLDSYRWDASRRRHAGWPMKERVQRISVDAYGARGTAHPRDKGADTFRIVFAGPSTLWGLEVDDSETITARLQATLGEAAGAPGTLEVWNLAGPAYVLKQSALRARRALRDLDPDLVLVMHTNEGPRCHLQGEPFDVGVRLTEDPWFAVEYLPPPRWLGAPRADRSAASWSSWIRSVPLPHRAWWALARRSHFFAALAGAGPRLDRTLLDDMPYADDPGRVEVSLLQQESDAAGVPLVFVGGPSSRPRDGVLGRRPERFIDLARPDLGWIFHELHPPAWVLAFHAQTIAHELSGLGLVPMHVGPPTVPSPPAGTWPVPHESPHEEGAAELRPTGS